METAEAQGEQHLLTLLHCQRPGPLPTGGDVTHRAEGYVQHRKGASPSGLSTAAGAWSCRHSWCVRLLWYDSRTTRVLAGHLTNSRPTASAYCSRPYKHRSSGTRNGSSSMPSATLLFTSKVPPRCLDEHLGASASSSTPFYTFSDRTSWGSACLGNAPDIGPRLPVPDLHAQAPHRCTVFRC